MARMKFVSPIVAPPAIAKWWLDFGEALRAELAEIDAWLLLTTARAGVLPEDIARRCRLVDRRDRWDVDGEMLSMHRRDLQALGDEHWLGWKTIGWFVVDETRGRFDSWSYPSPLTPCASTATR